MCGLAGYLSIRSAYNEAGEATIRAMTDTLHHRGPDDGDVWIDTETGIALGSRRLAIIDLSEAGHMPMVSACGRIVVAYNGEVYNAVELRAELEAAGYRFRGASDTEVIVEGCVHWGIEETLKRLIGMFAIAIWDRRERKLSLVRDRLGIKPLYWSWNNGLLIFGSELKALMRHPEFVRDIDRGAVAAFLRHNYVPSPHTIFRNVFKLEPGTCLTLASGAEPVMKPYWSLHDVARTGLAARTHAPGEKEAAFELEALLKDAVRRRMVSDVPLGAFLSGGIDSSAVVALMQAQSDQPVRTFSIGFEQSGYDEAPHAASVARHLGTSHTEMYVTAQDALNVIPSLPDYYDEPFSDSSQIPTFLISRLTRQHVTVALSGDGGDEVFGGYTRYFAAQKYGQMLFNTPSALRRASAFTLQLLPPSRIDDIFRLVPQSRRPSHPGDKIHKLAGLLRAEPNEFYRLLVSHWNAPEELVTGARESRGSAWNSSASSDFPDLIDRMQFLDTATYLPDDILTKVDRASMAVSLEVRVPFLDHRVVEYAWTLPQNFKVRDGQGKRILRKILDAYVPRQLVERPKMGFGVPIGEWMRGPLKEWSGDLLSESALQKHGILEPAPVLKKWREHQGGNRNWQYHLWDVLMLQAWCERYQA